MARLREMAVRAALAEREQLKKEAAAARQRAEQLRQKSGANAPDASSSSASAGQPVAPVSGSSVPAPADEVDADQLAQEIAAAAEVAAENADEVLKANTGETGKACRRGEGEGPQAKTFEIACEAVGWPPPALVLLLS